MANSFEKLQELNLSRDEVDKIGNALKNEEFRKLFVNYVEEIQNPENKKIYEKEITQLEQERGNDVTFIHPKPGYVIKTSVNGSQKGFINICSNEHVNKPSSSPTVQEGAKGLQWSLPHSLSPPREDIDNKRVRCQVFDVVYHPDTLHLAEKNSAFRTMVNNTACEAIEANFDVKLDKKNLKFPKLQYKGLARACVVRKPSATKPVERTPEDQEIYDKIFAEAKNFNHVERKVKKPSKKCNNLDDKSNYTSPKYVIKHRSHVDIQDFTEHKQSKINAATPKELIVEINLPLLKASSDIVLDVTAKTVQLTSEKPAKYKLHLTLPYQVNETCGTAKFDKDMRKLVVTLPVKRNTLVMLDANRDDSGVEIDSDHGTPGTPSSEDEFSEKLISEVQQPPSNETVAKSDQFRTNKFLDENLHYSLPEFTCHVFENVIAFTLNVKNVDEISVGKLFDSAGSFHVKFTSVSSSFYPCNYAFYVKLPLHTINAAETTVEVWDNNVVLQLPYNNNCDNKDLKCYFYGVEARDLTEKLLEEPAIINEALQESPEAIGDNFPDQKLSGAEKTAAINFDDDKRYNSRAIDISGTSYESSGDELSCSYSPSKGKGILKRLSSKRVGRSVSESSLDDYVCSSLDNGPTSFDSAIPEEDDAEVSTSFKKTVRFNDAVTRQLFRSNSSILGQKKKNQRKARNKKRALDRRHSESETSEVEEKRDERDLETSHLGNKENSGKAQEQVTDEDVDVNDYVHDIFHLDMDH